VFFNDLDDNGVRVLLQRFAAFSAALQMMIGICAQPAQAALVSPNLSMPRTPEVALRRSVPVVNAKLKEAVDALEEAQYLFRIPQRKPFGAMAIKAEDVRTSLSGDEDAALSGCLPERKDACKLILADLDKQLSTLVDALSARAVDRADVALYNSLELVSNLAQEEAPGLPFEVPQKFRDMPRLVGRARVRLVMKDSKTKPIELTLDGYAAPLTAGRMVYRMSNGAFDGVPLKKTAVALTAVAKRAPPPPPPSEILATEDGAEGEVPAPPPPARRGGNSLPPLPVEILCRGEFEPRYKSTIDVQEGDIPGLPLSVYGALAVPSDARTPGYSDDNSFFFYLFDPQDAGLGGASFDEGQYSVFGYVTDGADSIRSLGDGAVIQRVEVLNGLDKLVVP